MTALRVNQVLLGCISLLGQFFFHELCLVDSYFRYFESSIFAISWICVSLYEVGKEMRDEH